MNKRHIQNIDKRLRYASFANANGEPSVVARATCDTGEVAEFEGQLQKIDGNIYKIIPTDSGGYSHCEWDEPLTFDVGEIQNSTYEERLDLSRMILVLEF